MTRVERNAILHTNGNRIIILNRSGQMLSRAAVLCEDYERDLCDIEYNSTVYYAYITLKGGLRICSVLEKNFEYRIEAVDYAEYSNPRLIVFNGKLMLFYILHNLTDNRSMLTGCCVYPCKKTIVLPCLNYGEKINFDIFSFGNHLLVDIESSLENRILHISNDFKVLILSEEDLDYKNKLVGMQNDLDNMKLRLSEKEGQLMKYDEMLKKATIQYNELMGVAEAYKKEAARWCNLYIERGK